MLGIKRREFIALIGGAVAWPLAAHAQQPVIPTIGFLDSTTANAHSASGLPPGPKRGRVRRGTERGDRIPLGRRKARSAIRTRE